MSQRDEWVEKAKVKLDQWNAELDRLEAKAEVAKAEQKKKYERLLTDLRRYRDEARERLAEIEEKGDSAWGEIKDGVLRSWNALQKGFQAALEELRKEREEEAPGSQEPPPPA